MFGHAWRVGVACVAVAATGLHAAADTPAPSAARPVAEPSGQAVPHPKARLDRTGRTRVGKASFYARKLSGRKMADGTRMDPEDDSAASKTLPLGTTAKVTNLRTGQSAVVTIRDRGPYVKGRIVDLSPATAAKVGIGRHEGVSKVEVAPIAVPQPDGRTRAGAATQDTRPGALPPGSH